MCYVSNVLYLSIYLDDPISAMVRKVADQCKLSDVTVVHDVVNEMFEHGQAYDEYKEVMKAVEIKLQQQHVRSRVVIDDDEKDDYDSDEHG